MSIGSRRTMRGQLSGSLAQASGTSHSVTRRSLIKAAGAGALATAAFPAPYIIRSSSAQSEPLVFWNFYAPGGAVSTQSEWYENMVQAWNETHEVQVRLEYVPPPADSYYQKVATAFAGGVGPDIFLLSPSDFLRYANGNALVDVGAYMDDAAKADFFEGAMRSRTVEGKILGLPIEVQPLAMYYDVRAFEDAGLAEADIPQTWDQLFDVADQLTNDERYGVLFHTAPGAYQVFAWSPFMWQGDGDVFTPDGQHSAFNHPGTVQALQFWKDAIDSGVAPRSFLGNSGSDIPANLGVGYCAMQEANTSPIAAIRATAPDLEYGIFRLPVPEGGTYTTNSGGWAFVANSNGRNPEAAAEFIVWAIGSMEDDSITRVVDWCTKAKSDLPPRQSVLDRATEEGTYASGPLQIFAEEILPGARGESRTPPELVQFTTDAIQACQLGGADAQQTADATHEKIEAFFATYDGAPIL